MKILKISINAARCMLKNKLVLMWYDQHFKFSTENFWDVIQRYTSTSQNYCMYKQSALKPEWANNQNWPFNWGYDSAWWTSKQRTHKKI